VENGKFGRLFAEGRAALLSGTHQVQSVPPEGDPRWGISVILRPDPAAAATIQRVALAAAAMVGPDHWLPGAVARSHLTVRAGLEPRRMVIPDDDPLVASYAAALAKAAARPRPIRFMLDGLTLTPISVMARATPADSAADELAEAFAGELASAGMPHIGRPADIWYVNLVYFTGPVRDTAALVEWVAAHRDAFLTDLQVTEIRLTRWLYSGDGMEPVPMLSIDVPA
jgi:hypothetical protein